MPLLPSTTAPLQPFNLDNMSAGLCILGAVYFTFR